MHRRRFLSVAGLCTCFPTQLLIPSSALRPDHDEPSESCSWSLSAALTAARTTRTSGNARLDAALIAEVKKVDRTFGINPGYRYLRDDGAPNAYATSETVVPGTSGTILFGLTLLSQELKTSYGGAAVAGIAAHEGAHIFQYQSALNRRLDAPTDKLRELHADYLAGFYFSATGRTETSLVVFAESLFAKGDYLYNSPRHHGTPQARVAAMRSGYGAGRTGSNLTSAAEKGVIYVQTS